MLRKVLLKKWLEGNKNGKGKDFRRSQGSQGNNQGNAFRMRFK